jgi:hypothetical protein
MRPDTNPETGRDYLVSEWVSEPVSRTVTWLIPPVAWWSWEAVFSSETMITSYKSTRRHKSEDQHRHLHRRENVTSLASTSSLLVTTLVVQTLLHTSTDPLHWLCTNCEAPHHIVLYLSLPNQSTDQLNIPNSEGVDSAGPTTRNSSNKSAVRSGPQPVLSICIYLNKGLS